MQNSVGMTFFIVVITKFSKHFGMSEIFGS